MKEQILELYNAGWLPNRIAAQMQIHTKTVMDAIDGKEIKKRRLRMWSFQKLVR